MEQPGRPLYQLICPVCSLATPYKRHEDVHCERCGTEVHRAQPRSAQPAVMFALTALIFYFPANFFPFMTIELYGSRNTSTIWGGILTLMESGSTAIALIVFLASMVVPFFKLLALFYLAATAKSRRRAKFKTKLYRVVEAIGRWSMLDIFLLAVLIAIMKLGPWTHVEPGLGSLLFGLVVVFTMLASAYFDPQLLWKDEHEKISDV